MNFKILIISFFIFSFIGWICEIIYTRITDKEWVNRGFLIGPICPIYGIGCLMSLLLFDTNDKMITVCIEFMVICAILEYFTSYIFEKIFHARWWDYTDKKFNINGRICLETLILFGLGGTLFVFYINPFLIKILNNISNNLYYVISIILLVVFLIDLIVSSKIIFKFRTFIKKSNKNLDKTVEISKMVRNKLSEKSKLLKRLISAFPHIKAKTKIFIKNNK